MSDNQEQSGPTELELLKNRAKLMGITHSGNIGVETLREKINEKLAELDGDSNNSNNTQDINNDQSEEANQESENFDEDIEEDASSNALEQEEENGLLAAKQLADAKVKAPTFQPIKPIAPISPKLVEPGVSAKLGQPLEAKAGRKLTLRQFIYNEQMKLVRLQITNLDPKKADLQGELIAIANKYLGTVKMFVPYGEVTDDGWHIPYIIYKELERRKFLSIRTTKDRRTGQLKVTKSWAKEFSLSILPPLTEAELKQLATAQIAAGSIDAASDIL